MKGLGDSDEAASESPSRIEPLARTQAHPGEDEMTAETTSNDGGFIEVPRGTKCLRTAEILAHGSVEALDQHR
jgi:hypothetical protein